MASTRVWILATACVWLMIVGSAGVGHGQEGDSATTYTGAGELMKPTDFREWVFLGSGLGMTYSEPTGAASPRPPAFTNVFVNPAAYKTFIKTGTWPDRAIFILEIRGSTSEGSINKGGRFQTEVLAVEAAVKDSRRFAGNWAYFDFGRGDRAAPLPQTERCYACHQAHAAVEQTFVQFYPTLMEVARRMGTVNPTYQADRAAHAAHAPEPPQAPRGMPPKRDHMDHRFDDVERYAKAFDDPARDVWQMPDRVIAALDLKPGQSVADIGAGTGYFSVRLAKSAAAPKVYAVDVEPKMVEHIRHRAHQAGLRQIIPVQAASGSSHLPEPVDVALIVDTYHHIPGRVAYFSALKALLKPGGRVAVVDFRKGAPGGGPPDEFRFTSEQIDAELGQAGFARVGQHDFLPRQLFLIYEVR